MAVVYYIDNSFDWVADADSFAEVEAVDKALAFHPRWQYLEDEEKEALIINGTAQINSLDFKGSLIDDAQPLQFPRFMSAEGGEFSVREQVRRVFRAVVQQIEYNLNRAGIGAVVYSHGNESLTPRQDTICREAIQTLYPYLRSR